MFKKLKTELFVTNVMTLSLFAHLMTVPAAEAKSIVKVGQILERALVEDSNATYYLYVPSNASAQPPLFVTVHGISRNAYEHAKMFAPFAERYGVVVLAPLFPAQTYADYQRLGRNSDTEHAGRVMEAMVADVGRLTGAKTDRFFLFGYSGGGQFAHRYAMAHPDRIGAYAVGAAGWYTFPDFRLPYPLGIKPSKSRPDVLMKPKRFLEIPATVLVGEHDIRLDAALRNTNKVNGLQGESRLERGRRWVEAMRQAAKNYGLKGKFDFVALPKCGHSFSDCMRLGNMGGIVFDRLFGQQSNYWQTNYSSENGI